MKDIISFITLIVLIVFVDLVSLKDLSLLRFCIKLIELMLYIDLLTIIKESKVQVYNFLFKAIISSL